MRPGLLAAAISGCLCLLPTLVFAQEDSGEVAPSGAELLTDESPHDESPHAEGRPRVVLSRLIFPQDLPEARTLERHLRRTLTREARRADWGAGHGHKIEYRFAVDLLSVESEGGVLRVRCRATGELPKGKRAKSEISFGGEPKQRTLLMRRVMDIVAQGVIGRLAEMERGRRGRD